MAKNDAPLSSGRGRSHNAEGAREAILNAAEQIFAEHGFDGTRVDAIAEAAGYNKSLIFQYFGDKLNLYASVIRRADGQTSQFQNLMLAELLQEEVINDLNQVRAILRTYISQYFDYLVQNPNLMRILNWEMAEGWQTYLQIATERDRAEVEALNTLMQKVKDAGWLRSSFNATGQILVALFTGQIFLGLLPLFKAYLPNFDPQAADDLAQARDFIAEWITHGLIADSGTTTG